MAARQDEEAGRGRGDAAGDRRGRARLFLEHGYQATSIGRIAAEAGVAVQTIYNAVGSKRDLLSRVLDFAAAGERSPVPVPQFMREQAEPSPTHA